MIISGRIMRDEITIDLARRYDFCKKGSRVVLEELRERMTAKATKLKRYEKRTNQYRQNRLFESNQIKFSEELDGVERDDSIVRDVIVSEAFWSGGYRGKLPTIMNMLNG